MASCIFSGEPLNTQTKPEHVLAQAMGGRKSSKRIVSSDLNDTFGSTIDKALTSQVAELRAQKWA